MEGAKITIDDLAIMIKGGFDEVGEKMDKLDGRVGKLEKQVYEMGCDIKDLQVKHEKLEKKVDDLIDVVNGVFKIELIELKKRVSLIELKLGISA